MNRIQKGIKPTDLPFMRFTGSERERLRQMATSMNVSERRLCIRYLKLGTLYWQNYRFLVEICDLLIPDRSQYVRWQSLLLLGRFAEPQPELIWTQVEKWGSVKSKDIRIGVACCVLEHVLQYHFSEYFPKVKMLIEEGNKRFAFTLSHCYKSGEAEAPANAEMFDGLIEEYGKRIPGVN